MNKDNYVDLCSRAAYVGKREKIKPVDEYIKRETVIKGFTDLLQKPGDIYPTDITTMMQRIPAEEVRPVVQGKWGHLSGDEWVCTACGHVISTEGSWEHPLEVGKLYCENCGADMWEERTLPHWEACGDNQPISKDKVYCCPNPVCNKGRLLESQLTNYCPHCGWRLYKPEPPKEE